MELRHLRHFIVVAEEEHFGRASKRLHVVQPALTRHIQELEQELGVGLFDRVGRNVRLTSAGRVFLHDAKKVIVEIERATSHAQLASRGQIGTFNVSFVAGMTDTTLVPKVLAAFRGTTPQVKLELHLLPSHKQWAALRDREISVGFTYFLPMDVPALQSQPLFTTRVLLAMPDQHRLVRKTKIFLRDLRGENFVWFPRGVLPPYCDLITAACQRAGLTMTIANEAPNEPMLLGLTAAGVGMCFVLERGHRLRHVAFREVEDLGVELQAHAMWRSDDSSPILNGFLAVLQDVMDRREDGEAKEMRRAKLRRI